MKLLFSFLLINISIYSQDYKDTFLYKKEESQRDYDRYNSNNFYLPSYIGQGFQDGFYRINYNKEYTLSGEVKNKKKVGKWIIQSRYGLNRVIEELFDKDSITREYYTDWGNNGDLYLELEEILYPKLYNLSKDYYSYHRDSIHYGYKIKLMKLKEYSYLGILEREYTCFSDYRRIGCYKEYYKNRQVKKEAFYSVKGIECIQKDNHLFKDSLIIESNDTYSDLETGTTHSYFFYNSWYENGKEEQTIRRICDSFYHVEKTEYDILGNIEYKELYRLENNIQNRKIIFFKENKSYKQQIWRYNTILNKDELVKIEDY